MSAGDRSGARWIGLEHNSLLWRQQPPGAEEEAGEPSVIGRY
jgi:hypothetical protein